MAYLALAIACVSLLLNVRLYRLMQAFKPELRERQDITNRALETLSESVATHRTVGADEKVRQVLMAGPKRSLPREI